MFPKFVRSRFVLAFSILLSATIGLALVFGPAGQEETTAMFDPAITATKEDAFAPGGDVDGDGLVDPGDTIEYTVTINNTGVSPADDATGVKFEDILPSTLTLVPNSVEP